MTDHPVRTLTTAPAWLAHLATKAVWVNGPMHLFQRLHLPDCAIFTPDHPRTQADPQQLVVLELCTVCVERMANSTFQTVSR
jgi:hypothetical protein